MLMTREDRTGRGYCPGCNFEVEGNFHTDTMCYFSSGYSVLCSYCQDFDDFSYDMISIRNEAQRAIDELASTNRPQDDVDYIMSILHGSPWEVAK